MYLRFYIISYHTIQYKTLYPTQHTTSPIRDSPSSPEGKTNMHPSNPAQTFYILHTLIPNSNGDTENCRYATRALFSLSLFSHVFQTQYLTPLLHTYIPINPPPSFTTPFSAS